MTTKARFFAATGRHFQPYTAFNNEYQDGDATVARLIEPDTSNTLGGGIVTYRRVKTTWHLPFDEVVCVLTGSMVVKFGGQIWEAGPGDVLFFPKGEPIEYDIPGTVTVFYAKYPVTASTIT